MANARLIARMDIKDNHLIKSINFDGLRIIGNPNHYAKKYYHEGIDELIFMDCVASLYGRNSLLEIIKNLAKDIFVPITIGGGLRSVSDVQKALNSGADKVALNTAVVKDPGLIKKIISKFGSQSFVLSVEAKKINETDWNVFINNGKENTGINVVEWINKIKNFNVGEILLTSIDKDGTGKGMDLNLIEKVYGLVKVPLIISGGIGEFKHVKNVFSKVCPEAIALGYSLHYKKVNIKKIKNYLKRI
jgi:cyclase